MAPPDTRYAKSGDVHIADQVFHEDRLDLVAGIAVHIGARVSALADPGVVLASSTVRDLVAGSGLVFEDRGVHELKGVPGERRLFEVVDP